MKIKTMILAVVAMMTFAMMATAIPVRPGQWMVITLADGTQVRVEAKGDEFVQFFQSEDGRVFERTEAGQYNEITRAIVAQRATEARLAENQRVAELMGKDVPKNINMGDSHEPYLGSKRCLCILMEYKDLKFKPENNATAFNNMINTLGYSRPEVGHKASVRDYFLAQSNGLFDMQFDVVGPFTTNYNFAYYGSRGYALAEEAVTKANPYVNFVDYDWDSDGSVEPIFIVYAGPAKSDYPDDPAYDNYIWPHASSMWKFLDGVQITKYACGAELDASGTIDGIGTMCHEYSHCLGLPDTYDVDYECNTPTPDKWDIMCGGPYNGGGNLPAPYNAYERMYCGWLTPEQLPMGAHVENMTPITEGGKAYSYKNDKNANEYYLFEVHGKEGFDAGLPGPGMLVYHVDFDKNIWAYNGVNCLNRVSSNNHSRFTILPANNVYDKSSATQAYPSEVNNRISFYAAPTLTWFKNDSKNHDYAEVCLYNITRNENNAVSFDVANDLPKTPAPEGALFYESFDLNNLPSNKGGRDGVFTKVPNVESFNDNRGWDGTSFLGASKSALVGNGKTQTDGDYAMTPVINLEDGVEYSLTFSVAPYSIKTTAVEVSVAQGTAQIEEASFPLTRSQWSDCSTKLTGNGPVRLKFSRATGFYLDEVLVMPTTTGIEGVTAAPTSSSDGRIFNVLGQQVSPSTKGIVIRNGKKFLQK